MEMLHNMHALGPVLSQFGYSLQLWLSPFPFFLTLLQHVSYTSKRIKSIGAKVRIGLFIERSGIGLQLSQNIGTHENFILLVQKAAMF